MNESPVYSVTQVNQYIKGLLDQDQTMTALYVRGRFPTTRPTPQATTIFPSRTPEGPSGASCSGGRRSLCASGRRTA